MSENSIENSVEWAFVQNINISCDNEPKLWLSMKLHGVRFNAVMLTIFPPSNVVFMNLIQVYPHSIIVGIVIIGASRCFYMQVMCDFKDQTAFNLNRTVLASGQSTYMTALTSLFFSKQPSYHSKPDSCRFQFALKICILLTIVESSNRSIPVLWRDQKRCAIPCYSVY